MSTRIVQLCVSAALLAGLMFGGCIENGRSFVIMFAAFPEEDTCTLPVQSGDSFSYSSAGKLDLNHAAFGGEPYFNLGAQIHNYILANPNDNPDFSNTNVLLQRYEVRYKWINGRELLLNNPAALGIEDIDFSMATTGFVSGASSVSDPGRTMFAGTVLPKEVGNLLRTIDPQLLDALILRLNIRVFGQTTGGDAVKSNTFHYPLYLCWDCVSSGLSCWPGQESIAGSGSSPSCDPISSVNGSHLTIGDDFEVRWTTGGGAGLVDIFIQCGSPSSNRIVASRTSNDGSFTWTVPGPASTGCAFTVECSSDGSNSDSGPSFSISD